MTITKKRKSFANSVIILTLSTLAVKVIGALFKIPLTNMVGELGMGYFNSAYQIYMPIYTIATAGFPVAVAKLVSESYTLKRYKTVRKVFKVSFVFFLISGAIGFLAMLFLAQNYCIAISSVNSYYTIIVMSPTILFCCLMACYRGFYEGMQNMVPTAISQLIEATSKMFLGLYLARLFLNYGINQFNLGNSVYGNNVNTLNEAVNASLPFSACGAILGVTIGSVLGFLFLVIYRFIKGDGITFNNIACDRSKCSNNHIFKRLYKIALPVCIGALVLNIGTLIDVTLLQNRLGTINSNLLKEVYGSLIAKDISDNEVAPYLYGCFTIAQNIAMLVPTVSQAIGISALPAVASAWAVGRKNEIKKNVQSVLKISSLIAFPTGLGLMAIPYQSLYLLFSSRQNAVAIAFPVLRLLAISAIFTTLSVPINSMLQAVGKTLVPVKLLACGIILKLVLSYSLISIPSVNMLGSAISSIGCYAVVFIGGIIILLKTTKIKIDSLNIYVKPIFASVLSSVSAFCAYGFLKGVAQEKMIIIMSILIAVLIYILSLLLTKTLTKNDILMLPKGEKLALRLEKYNLLG